MTDAERLETQKRIAGLEAEVARLRAALERIVKISHATGKNDLVISAIVRNALKGA